MSRAPNGGSLLAAAPRRTGTIVIVSVVLIGTAFGGGAFWIMAHSNNAAPTAGRVPGFAVGGVPSQFAATGTRDGPGGCRAPGAGQTEYCYQFVLVECCAGLSYPLGTTSGAVELTSDDLGFGVELPTGAPAPYQNFTLLDPSNRILATYTAAGGWAAYGSNVLPVPVQASTEWVILNFGTSSAAGDSLIVYNQGSTAGGQSSTPLP